MEKLKINTVSGNAMEKPVVTAFKSNSGEYVVLDNEMNGTMGLPIILVSKLVNNTLEVVPDSEWNAVKEALRLIISGNHVDYISVNSIGVVNDVFYKQLTLPVASFDVLKNSYKPVVEEVPQVSVETVMDAPVEAQVLDSSSLVQEDVAPSVAPIIPDAPIMEQSVSEVVPVAEVEAPVVEDIPEESVDVPVDFTADKEAFLKACENMFDALVAKFNNK